MGLAESDVALVGAALACVNRGHLRPTPLGRAWYRPAVGTKAERRAASKSVSAYHEAQLAHLIEHIAAAVDRYRAGEIDAYAVDETLHHYHQAARELWKFCWSGGGGTASSSC